MSYYEKNKDKWKEYSKRCKEQKKLTAKPSVYKLECNKTGLIYVGSTCHKLYDRKGKHMWDYRNPTSNISARKVIEGGDWDIHLLEEVDDKSLLKQREQYWIDTLDCVNVCSSYNTNSLRDASKKYHMKNKERRNEYSRNAHEYRSSWGGDLRRNNNLLLIDLNLFC